MITPLHSPYRTEFAGGVNPWGEPKPAPTQSNDYPANVSKDEVCAWLVRHGSTPCRVIAQGLDTSVSRVYTKLRPMLKSGEVIAENRIDHAVWQKVWFYRLREVLQ